MSAATRISNVPPPWQERSAAPRRPRSLACMQAVVTGPAATGNHWCVECEDSGGDLLQLEARAADGLLLVPAAGDTVLCVELAGDWVLVQILLRAADGALTFASARDVDWVAPRIRLSALRELELASAGRLACSGVDLVLAAGRTCVQQARHLLQQVGDFSLTARGLLRCSARQQLITAEEDVRIDGKRISMG